MSRIRARRLRHALEVRRRVQTRAADGGVTAGWEFVARIPCEIQALRGREVFEAQKVESRVTHRIRLRHYPGLSPKDRGHLDDGRVLNFHSVIEIGLARKEMEILAEEVEA